MVALDNGALYVTAYFAEPSTICTTRKAEEDCVGDSLIIQNGTTPKALMRIPLKESGIAASKWVKGKCFIGMGESLCFPR